MQYTQDYDEYYPLTRNGTATVSTGGSTWALWKVNTYPYVKSTQIYSCPSGSKSVNGIYITPNYGTLTFSENNSYGASEYVFANGNNLGGTAVPINQAAIGKTSEMAMIADATYAVWNRPSRIINSNYTINQTSPPDMPDPQYARHFEGSNVLFADGHVKFRSQGSMASLVAAYNDYQWGLAYALNDPRLK